MIRRAAPFLVLALLANCAGQARHYPSLAPRAAEKQGFAEPAAKPVVVAPDLALDQRLATQSVDLDRIATGFKAAADTARHVTDAAAHQPVGSDAWLNAQAALARVDDWRAQASALATDIEATGSARAATLSPPYPALDALAARAAAETEREAGVVQQLQARLPAA